MTVNAIKTGNKVLVPIRLGTDVIDPGVVVAVYPSSGLGKPDLAVVTAALREGSLDTLTLAPYKKMGFSVSDGQALLHLVYKEFRRGEPSQSIIK